LDKECRPNMARHLTRAAWSVSGTPCSLVRPRQVSPVVRPQSEGQESEGMGGKPKRLPEKAITALYRKDYETLQRLVDKDAINLPDEHGSTLLMLAVSAGDGPQLVKFLIDRGADVNRVEGSQRFTVLQIAAQDVRRECVPVLLEAGADANAQDAN